jgi:hypothetical protein
VDRGKARSCVVCHGGYDFGCLGSSCSLISAGFDKKMGCCDVRCGAN